MKKVTVMLCLGLAPAWIQSDDGPSLHIVVLQKCGREIADEALTKLVGDHSLKVAGVPLLTTKEAAHILGDFVVNRYEDINAFYEETGKKAFTGLNTKTVGKELAKLYAKEKLISGTHWVLGKKAGLSLPQWVKDSGACMATLDISERIAAAIVASLIVDKLWKDSTES